MTRVAADAAHQVLEGVTVEDTVGVLARHGDVLASYTLNQHQAPNEFTLTVVCERGTLRFEGHRQQFRWMTEPAGVWQEEQVPPVERDELFVTQADRFLDVLDGAAPLCPLEEGVQTLRATLAILQACTSRQWVSVPDREF